MDFLLKLFDEIRKVVGKDTSLSLRADPRNDFLVCFSVYWFVNGVQQVVSLAIGQPHARMINDDTVIQAIVRDVKGVQNENR